MKREIGKQEKKIMKNKNKKQKGMNVGEGREGIN